MVGGIGRFLGKIFKTAGPKASAPPEKPTPKPPPEPKAGVAANQKDTFERLEPRAGKPPPPRDAEPPKGPPKPLIPGAAPRPDGPPPAASGAASKPAPGTVESSLEPEPTGLGRQRSGADVDLAPLDPVKEWDGETPELGEHCARPGGANREGPSEVRGKSPLGSDEEDLPPKTKE